MQPSAMDSAVFLGICLGFWLLASQNPCTKLNQPTDVPVTQCVSLLTTFAARSNVCQNLLTCVLKNIAAENCSKQLNIQSKPHSQSMAQAFFQIGQTRQRKQDHGLLFTSLHSLFINTGSAFLSVNN